ncbi:unnamed protein product [Ophioblennius macclurei]
MSETVDAGTENPVEGQPAAWRVQLLKAAPVVEEMSQKEKMLSLFLKKKLQKEQRNTAMNRLKLTDIWRKTLRETREKELRADVKVQKQMFEKQLNNQDSVIKTLLLEIQEAEWQDAQVWQAHAQYMEYLHAHHDQHLRDVEQHWGVVLRHAGSIISSGREQTLAEFQRQHEKLQDLMLSTEQRHEEESNNMQQLYDDCRVHREEHILKPIDVGDRDTLEKNLLNLQKLNLLRREKTRKNNVYRKNIEKMKITFQHLKEQLSKVKLENKLLLEDQKAARDEVKRHCNELQDWLAQIRNEAKERLTRLSVMGNNTSKKIEAANSKGVRVLRVGEACIKFENKLGISPPPSFSPSSLPSEKHTLLLTQHMTAALLRRQAALLHRDRLRQQNQELRALISQHVASATLDGCCTPLTIVQAPATKVWPGAIKHHTIHETVHAIKHSM